MRRAQHIHVVSSNARSGTRLGSGLGLMRIQGCGCPGRCEGGRPGAGSVRQRAGVPMVAGLGFDRFRLLRHCSAAEGIHQGRDPMANRVDQPRTCVRHRYADLANQVVPRVFREQKSQKWPLATGISGSLAALCAETWSGMGNRGARSRNRANLRVLTVSSVSHK